MARIIRLTVLTLALLALFGGASSGNEVAAGSGYAQWTGPYSDRCYYHWDGYAYSSVACPRVDSGYDFYSAGYGQWVYSFSAGWMTNGDIWLYFQGFWYVLPQPASGMVIGGGSWSSLTTNVYVNQILIDSNNAIINTILSPNCVEVVAGVCYTY